MEVDDEYRSQEGITNETWYVVFRMGVDEKS